MVSGAIGSEDIESGPHTKYQTAQCLQDQSLIVSSAVAEGHPNAFSQILSAPLVGLFVVLIRSFSVIGIQFPELRTPE